MKTITNLQIMPKSLVEAIYERYSEISSKDLKKKVTNENLAATSSGMTFYIPPAYSEDEKRNLFKLFKFNSFKQSSN
jgi:enterochelin esterase-like enzyme